MPVYPVELFEGNEPVIYEVTANSPEEAKDKALAHREQRFRENTTRESLEREKSELEQASKDRLTSFEAGAGGAMVGISATLTGAVDSTLNMAQGLAGMWSGLDGGASVAKLQQARNSNAAQHVEMAIDVNQQVLGRAMTDAEKGRTAADQAKFIERGKFATDIATGIGTGVATLSAKTVPRMLALGFAEGGIGGYLMADTNNMKVDEGTSKRIKEATYGAVLGTALSIVPSIVVGAKNWMGRRINRAAGGADNLQAAREELRRLGIYEATPAQITGDPRLAVPEMEAAGAQAQTMFAGQMDDAVQGVARQAGVNLPPVADLLEGSAPVIRNTMEQVQDAISGMYGVRNTNFRKALENIGDASGNAPVIPSTSTLDEFHGVLKEIGEEFGDSTQFSSLFLDSFGDVARATQAGGLTARQTNAILTRLNGMQRTGRGLFDMGQDAVVGQEAKFAGFTKIKAKQLKLALMNSMDNAADGMPGSTGAMLKDARKAYGADSQAIHSFEDAFKDTVGLGGTPAKILQKLDTADPAQARAFVEQLRKFDGGQEVIDDMNQYLIREAVRKSSQAKVGKGLREGDFDISTFVTELSASGQASRLKGLLLPEQEKAFANGLRSLRRLLNAPQFRDGIVRTRMALDMQHIAINAISRDPGFMARILGGAVQQGAGVEALFFTRAGQEILFNAVNFSLKAPKTAAQMQAANATVAYLGSMQGAGHQLRQLFSGDEKQN